MQLETYSIPTFRQGDIQKRLDKLAKKARKYGNEDITYSFGEPYIHEYKTAEGVKRRIQYVDITVSGEAPKINGWTMVARVELMDGENLIHTVPGTNETVDAEFRTHDGHCDHCNTLRHRNDVYVLTDGEKQIAVGRNCLRDHLGIDDPKRIVSRAQFFEELSNFEEEDYGNFGGWGNYSLKEVLIVAAAHTRLKGYVPVSRAMECGFEATSDAVKHTLNGTTGYKIESTDEDLEWAEKTIEFFRNAEEFDNEYMNNLRILMQEDIVRPQHVGIIASSVSAVQRQLARKKEIKIAAAESNYVGEVKERLRGLELTLTKIINLGMSSFGTMYLHLMKDADGNVFSWITGNKMDAVDGDTIIIDATVKQHKLYNDVKQTVLTRAKVK